MKISQHSQLAAIRFGGLAFSLILLWAWFRPIGYAWNEHAGTWNEHAGIALDGLLAIVSGALALIQIHRYKRDLRAQEVANDAR